MGEFITNEAQLVDKNSNILFLNTRIRNGRSVMHRDGSGLTTLRALSTRCGYAKFIISFGANLALPEKPPSEEPLSVAIAINGEPIPYSEMTTIPLGLDLYTNVSRTLVIEIPNGTCAQVSVKNTGDEEISVKNATLLIDRIA